MTPYSNIVQGNGFLHIGAWELPLGFYYALDLQVKSLMRGPFRALGPSLTPALNLKRLWVSNFPVPRGDQTP